MAFNVIADDGLITVDAVEVIDTIANSYASVSDFLTYWLERNTDYSDYDPEALQANLIKATDYIERRSGQKFFGIRYDGTQALSWPRQSVYTRDGVAVIGVPLAIRKACMEYAARALLGTALWSDPAVNRNVKKTVSQLGPIRDEVEYVGGGLTSETFPLADALIAPFVMTPGSTYR